MIRQPDSGSRVGCISPLKSRIAPEDLRVPNLYTINSFGIFSSNRQHSFGIPTFTGYVCYKLCRPGYHSGMREWKLLSRFKAQSLCQYISWYHVWGICLEKNAQRRRIGVVRPTGDQVSNDLRSVLVRRICDHACKSPCN